MASKFSKCISKLPNHKIVAVHSRNLKKAEQFISENKLDALPGNDFELNSSLSRDTCLYIATPPGLHYKHIIKGLEKSFSILSEKPITMNFSQIQNIRTLALEKKALVVDGLWFKFLPQYRKLKFLVLQGIIGEILEVSTFHGKNISQEKSPRLYEKELGGGSFFDLGIYGISLTTSLLGFPVSFEVNRELNKSGVDIWTEVKMVHKNGAFSTNYSSITNVRENKAVITGSLGKIYIDPPFYELNHFVIVFNNTGKSLHFSEISSMKHEVVEFTNLVKLNARDSISNPWSEVLELIRLMEQFSMLS
jgi:predicted dehydrogenase